MKAACIKGNTVRFADFTQVGEVGGNVGEVEVVKGVESDVRKG